MLSQNNKVKKITIIILSVLQKSLNNKFDAISEARDVKTFTMKNLIGNFIIHKLKKQHDPVRSPKKEKILTLEATKGESSEEDRYVSYITKRFQKAFKRGGAFSIRCHTSRSIGPNDLFHECGMPCKFITDCPQPKLSTKTMWGIKVK